MTEPINTCMQRWHAHMRGQLDGGLDEVLHPDVVFLSPVVFTPQRGRDITKLYLAAAGGTLAGGGTTDIEPESEESEPAEWDGRFRYVKEVLDGHHAVLEFETTMDGKYVNGVDVFTCDDDGMVTELKVMVRPLQAMNIVHQQMQAMLERLESSS